MIVECLKVSYRPSYVHASPPRKARMDLFLDVVHQNRVLPVAIGQTFRRRIGPLGAGRRIIIQATKPPSVRIVSRNPRSVLEQFAVHTDDLNLWVEEAATRIEAAQAYRPQS